ncbi:hypothetical protein AJ80_04594 [Polytolypa hystricis UAMH7299]|uniref:PXA domain-containing protein n=1 Tax=Polytolypa hystricis (strain UAMH7299) TaxID=1447883 RepID=A0A2B7YAA7_POLH7|nr:hypothetical protein AJ80_04594 [Polytolypa hystricis UAMH7299]
MAVPTTDSKPDWSPASESPQLESSCLPPPEKVSQPTDSVQSKYAQPSSLTHDALRWVSRADYTTLVALCGAVFALSYLLFGQLSLLVVGLLGGSMLHALWEPFQEAGNGELRHEIARRKHELGIEVVSRLLARREHEDARSTLDESHLAEPTNLEPTQATVRPAIAVALDALTDGIIREYVRWWYQPLLPTETAFVRSCHSSASRFATSICSHLSRKREADVLVHLLTNTSSIVIVFLNELSTALQHSSSDPSSPADAVNVYLNDFPESNLANVLSVTQQQAKLKLVASDILQSFLDKDAYNCEPMRMLLQEMLSGVVLESVIKSCSRPEWINGWIVHFLKEGEPELLHAIDAGVNKARQVHSETLEAVSSPKISAESQTQHSLEDNMQQSSQSVFAMSQEPLKVIAGVNETGNFDGNETTEAQNGRPRSNVSVDLGGNRKSKSGISLGLTKLTSDQASSSCENRKLLLDSETPCVEATDGIGILTSTPDKMPFSSPEESYFSKMENSHNRSQSSFETLLPSNTPLGVTSSPSLLGATVSIVDDGNLSGSAILRTKPSILFFLQVELAGSRHSGWVIIRKYADFETLHETLRRISVISGVPEFSEQHKELPTWKATTLQELQKYLEVYLRHALQYKCLAECDGMKRFMEKEREQSEKSGLAFPNQNMFENMGKGVLGALSNAPKGVAGGGKAVLEGVTGVFGAVGIVGKRSLDRTNRPSISMKSNRASEEETPSRRSLGTPKLKSSNSQTSMTPLEPTIDRQPDDGISIPLARSEGELSGVSGTSKASECATTVSVTPDDDHPSAMPDANPRPLALETVPDLVGTSIHPVDLDNKGPSHNEKNIEPPRELDDAAKLPRSVPLSEEETRIVVELLFAVITEIYGLSSAWNIRKKLLNASKSFLLRPGNPHIETIRKLVQESVVESNTSDEAIAGYLTQLRQNVCPTTEDVESWPSPPSNEEKDELRVTARKLLITSGMPIALTSIMGASATEESLGRIFDCLQMESVARGFAFAMLLQVLKVMVQ